MSVVNAFGLRHAGPGAAFACFLAIGICAGACAEEPAPRHYAVMSLIGDSIAVSPFISASGSSVKLSHGWADQSTSIGSHLPLEGELTVPQKDTVFDDTAVATVANVLRQSDPAATLEALSTRNASLYRLQDEVFDAPEASKNVREGLKALLKERNATHLILVTKHRSMVEMLADAKVLSSANLRLLSGNSADSLRMEGIGYYVDDRVLVQDLKTLDRSRGVLAAFINATVRLVDAKTLGVVRAFTISKSMVIAIAKPGQAGFSAWDEATDAQKAVAMQKLIRAAMEEAAPKLLVKGQ